MIMQKLRKTTKYFMWVIAVIFVLFIFFGFGSNMIRSGDERSRNLIAEVNGKGIDYRQYSSVLNSNIRMISGAVGIDPLKERRLSDQIVNQLIMEEILNEQLNKRDIFVSDEQVIDIVKNSPPQEILADTTFWIGGQFDYNRYYQILTSPRASRFVSDYAQQIKENVPKGILAGEINSLVRITNNELIENLMEDSLQFRVEYIRIPVNEWIKEEPTLSPEVFYSNNQDLFRREEWVRLGYLSFPVDIDEEMINSRMDLARSIIKRAENVPFDTLVRIYSYLPEGRILFNGWIPIKSLRSRFTNALLGTKTGEITGPVQSEEGLHIFKLINRERNRLNLKEIFLPLFPSTEAYMKVQTEIVSVARTLRDDSIIHIPEKYTPSYLTYGIGYLPDIGVDFGTFLDEVEEGEISYPLAGRDSLYLFWVEDVIRGIPAFAEIREEVIDTMLLREARESAREYARNIFKGDRLPRHPTKGERHSTPYFTLRNYKDKGIDLPEKIVYLASNLREGKASPPIGVGRYVYIIKVRDRKELSDEYLKEMIPEYAQNLQMEKQTVFYHGWLYDLRKKAEIKDWRGKLYE